MAWKPFKICIVKSKYVCTVSVLKKHRESNELRHLHNVSGLNGGKSIYHIHGISDRVSCYVGRYCQKGRRIPPELEM